MKRILLTGGAGFIGSSLARQLLARPGLEMLVVLDALTYAGKLENLRSLDRDPRFHFVQGNILDQNLLSDLFQKFSFTGIFNLAAESHVDRSIAASQAFAATNVLGVSLLLETARHSRIPFLQCGTDEVYGPTPHPEKFNEGAPLRPTSPYAASKAAADHFCLAAHLTHGQPVVIARPTNNYGARQDPEKLIPLLVNRAVRDEFLPIYGSGRQIRDWLHVEDCAAGLIACLEKGRPGGVYNLGANSERTNLGLAHNVLKILRKPESLIRHVTDRPGHDVRYALDASLARRKLNWKPRMPLREGLPPVVREIAARAAMDLGG